MKRAKSLRRWGLIITAIGVIFSLSLILYIELSNRYNYTGVMLLAAGALYAGCLITIGGVLVLIVDGILRLTGRRY